MHRKSGCWEFETNKIIRTLVARYPIRRRRRLRRDTGMPENVLDKQLAELVGR